MSGRVEFVGAPASGKTTLVSALAGRRISDGRHPPQWLVPAERLGLVPRSSIRVLTRAFTRPAVIAVLARMPRVAATLLVPDAATSSPSEQRDVLRRMARERAPSGPRGEVAYRRQALRWLDETLALMDAADRADVQLVPVLAEGLVQRSVTLLGADVDPTPRAELLRSAPIPRLLVHLRPDADVLAARLRARERAGVATELHAGRGLEETLRLAEEDARALADTVDLLAQDGWPVLTLDVARGDDVVDHVTRVIRALQVDGGSSAGAEAR